MLVAEDIALAFDDAGGRAFSALEVPRFAAEPGRITAISGPSGSGKSTLLYVLAGLLPPQRGVVRDDEVSIYAMREGRRDAWRRRRIGFIFQDFHLVPELSPLANAALPATFARASGARQRAGALLAELGVPMSRRTVELLSRGEKQRVAIARALLFDPPIILADEPSASLDRAATVDLMTALRRLARDGRTVVLTSHDETLLAVADRHLRLDHGKLRAAA